MKKNKLWHLIWIIGIYASLLVILYLVVQYKVKWEDKDLSKYLYFYNCGNQFCTTDNKSLTNNYYSKIKCEKNNCPYIADINNNFVILVSDDSEFVYNYKTGKIVNEYYSKYSFVNGYLLAKNNNDKYGIVDLDGNIQVEFKYNKITDYKDSYIAYSENSKIGIVNEENNINIKPTYEKVSLISDSIYAYCEDNKYYIAAYDTELPINNENYDYVDSINNLIITIKDKKFDIMDTNLKSMLLLKIDTFYGYTIEKERDSLNIYLDNNLLYFTIVNEKGETNYIYDTKNNKLIVN